MYACAVPAAASRLDLTPDALRARLRRRAQRRGRDTVADLGNGIVAYKLGCHWRVQFPARVG